MLLIFIFIVFFYSCNSCEEFGAFELGNNLVLMEGDRLEDRIIVRCTGRTEQECCKGGQYILPLSYNEHVSNRRYREYVEVAKSNEKWIIVKTIRLLEAQKENFWVIEKNFDLDQMNCFQINCDSIIKSNIVGPLNQEDFLEHLDINNVKLKFNEN